MRNMVDILDENGVVEYDYEPWLALVVRGKTTSGNCSMAQVPVDTVCVLPKTEPSHSPIFLPCTLMKLCSTGNRHMSKLLYFCGYG